MATTALCNSFKAELLNGGHVFQAPEVFTANAVSGSYAVTGISSTYTANIAVGMSVSATSVQASTVVAAVSTNGLTLSLPTTGTITNGTFTLAADVFKIALIIASPTLSGGYGANQTSYGTGSGTPSLSNLGTDELANGNGYTTGGFTLTDVTAVMSSGTAYITFGVNPSWSAATFSASAALIYNTSTRIGGVANRAVAVLDFGGTQSVTAGVFTLIVPAATSSTALIRLS